MEEKQIVFHACRGDDAVDRLSYGFTLFPAIPVNPGRIQVSLDAFRSMDWKLQEVFLYRIEKYIGAYAAVMDGLDAVVLTAGIGENMPLIKERIAKDLKGFLDRFKAKVLVISTNEEMMIAQETSRIVTSRAGRGKGKGRG